MHRANSLLVVLTLALSAAGCVGENGPPGPPEFWMKTCSTADDCNGVDCVCGLCSPRCDRAVPGEASECDIREGVCRSPGEVPGAECGGATIPTGICVADCLDASDCPNDGEGFTCQARLCVSDDIDLGCQPADCGPAPTLPNRLCDDGRTVSGPTGRCIETGVDQCDWEILSCP